MPTLTHTSRRATTRRWALSGPEWATTGVAAAVSAAGYVIGGQPYLARGVVGDLLGFAILGSGGALAGGRVRHEAATCLVVISAVLAVDPQWPLRLREAGWWAVFGVGAASYLALRRRLCD